MNRSWIVWLAVFMWFAVAPVRAVADQQIAASAPVEQAAEAGVDARLEDARRRLEEAAREVAELSAQSVKTSFRAERMNRGLLGVVLAPGAGDGLLIAGVTPGGGAAKAGLVAGDVIVAINSQPVDAQEEQGSARMLGVLGEVKPGDHVRIDYERDGVPDSVDVVTQEQPPFAFAMSTMALPEPPAIDFMDPPQPGEPPMFAHHIAHPPMMLHDLDEKLGHYFGVTEGVLVLTASTGEQGVEPGDVVKSVAGVPVATSVDVHRALMSAKEETPVEVLRDGGLVTVQVKPPAAGTPWTMAFPAGEVRSIRAIRSDDGAEPGEASVNVDVIVHEE